MVFIMPQGSSKKTKLPSAIKKEVTRSWASRCLRLCAWRRYQYSPTHVSVLSCAPTSLSLRSAPLSVLLSLHSPDWRQGEGERFEDRPICSDIKRCLALWEVARAERLTDISTGCLLGLLTLCPLTFLLCPTWTLLSYLHSKKAYIPLGFGAQHLVRQGLWLHSCLLFCISVAVSVTVGFVFFFSIKCLCRLLANCKTCGRLGRYKFYRGTHLLYKNNKKSPI